MARIRTIKPTFWDSPDTARADLACRLLFIAMWNYADDSGKAAVNLKHLEGFAFPNDDVTTLPRRASAGSCRNSAACRRGWPSFAELLRETAETYGVTLYRVDGRTYYAIGSFQVHQSRHFNPNSTLPNPEDGEIWDLTSEYGLDRDIDACDSCRDSAASRRDLPLDRDRDRDRDNYPLAIATDVQTAPAPADGRAVDHADTPPAPDTPNCATDAEGAVEVDAITSTAAELVGAVIPNEHPRQTRAILRRHTCTMLRNGVPPDVVRDTLHLWLAKTNAGPSMLPWLADEAIKKRSNATQSTTPPANDDKVIGWKNAGNRWLTNNHDAKELP